MNFDHKNMSEIFYINIFFLTVFEKLICEQVSIKI